MSVVRIPEAAKGANDKQCSVQMMLIENSQLIESIAEYQRQGRMDEAVKYQELLHQNLLFLGNLVDPQIAAQVQEISNPPQQPQHMENPPQGISVNVQDHSTFPMERNPMQPPPGHYYSPNMNMYQQQGPPPQQLQPPPRS